MTDTKQDKPYGLYFLIVLLIIIVAALGYTLIQKYDDLGRQETISRNLQTKLDEATSTPSPAPEPEDSPSSLDQQEPAWTFEPQPAPETGGTIQKEFCDPISATLEYCDPDDNENKTMDEREQEYQDLFDDYLNQGSP